MAGKLQSAVGLATTLAATSLARKAVDATWQLGARRKPPTDPTDPETQVREAMLWAVLSGAAVGVAKMWAGRRLAASARRQPRDEGAAKNTTAKALTV